MFVKFLDIVGKISLSACNGMGNVGLFLYDSLVALFSTKPKTQKIFY